MSVGVASQTGQRGELGAGPFVWLVASAMFAAVGAHLASNAFVSTDLASLWAARGATPDGVWLSSLLVNVLHWLPDVWAQWFLSFVSAVGAGLGVALLFANLRRNDWPLWQTLALLTLLSGNAFLVYAITAANSAIPFILACALMIPNIRRLESVGDVQAEMGFGLVLPLFLLAGPETAPLVPVLAAMSAFSDPRARGDWRAFIAMFLVAILPSLIVLAGLLMINDQTGHTLADFLAPYLATYVREGSPSWSDALVNLFVFAPVGVLPMIYCLFPDRRMKPFSALAVVALPLYLALARAVLGWDVAPWAPAAALLGGFCAWLAASRMRANFRFAALGLLTVSAGLSWVYAESWADPRWVQALRGELAGLENCEGVGAPCDSLRGRLNSAVPDRPA